MDISPTQLERLGAAKLLIYQGLLAASGSVGASVYAGALVDEEFAAAVLALVRRDGLTLAVCVEQSGRTVYDFAYPDWQRHLDRVAPDFAKVLVRDNPADEPADRIRQRDRIRTLASFLHATGRRLLELLVPPTDGQLAAAGGNVERYAAELRVEFVIRAIGEFHESGVEADVWKVEGLRDVAGYRAIADAVRAGGFDGVGCVVLGAGAPVQRVTAWLVAAAQVPAFIGFAVGRSIWWDIVGDWHAQRSSAKTAIARIAGSYLAMVRAFTTARDVHIQPGTGP